MSALRGLLWVLGALMALMGLLWVGQGLGIVKWPDSSFMIGDRRWTTNGAALAVFGVALMWVSRKLR